MRIKILGRWWGLRWTRQMQHRQAAAHRGQVIYGECDPPTISKKEIRIRTGLSDETEMEILIHEMLHAANWHIDEEFVAKFAEDAARALTRVGFKKCESQS